MDGGGGGGFTCKMSHGCHRKEIRETLVSLKPVCSGRFSIQGMARTEQSRQQHHMRKEPVLPDRGPGPLLSAPAGYLSGLVSLWQIARGSSGQPVNNGHQWASSINPGGFCSCPAVPGRADQWLAPLPGPAARRHHPAALGTFIFSPGRHGPPDRHRQTREQAGIRQ